MSKTYAVKKRKSKYYTPQNGEVEHICDFPGCTKKGEFKAPKDKKLNEYYWYCLEHVQEYNSSWNYYNPETGEPEPEETPFANKTRFTSFGSKIKYKFGCNLDEELEYLHNFTNSKKYTHKPYFNDDEKREMKNLELDLNELDIKKLKAQYKKLAKTCHPDLHPDDKEAEEKFKRLTQAYNKLLAKLS